MSSLDVTDQAAEAVRKAPRVTLADIEAKIARKHFALGTALVEGDELHEQDQPLEYLTICVLITKSGFTVLGKSAPAAPENFDADLGKQFAYEDAVRQLWPLEGYLLRDRLAAESAE